MSQGAGESGHRKSSFAVKIEYRAGRAGRRASRYVGRRGHLDREHGRDDGEDELSSLSEIDKWQLHQRIQMELTEPVLTAIDTCMWKALYYIDRLCQNKYKP